MADKPVDLEAVTRMVADKIALAHAMFDGTGRAPFIEFGFSDAEDVRTALAAAREENDGLGDELTRAHNRAQALQHDLDDVLEKLGSATAHLDDCQRDKQRMTDALAREATE